MIIPIPIDNPKEEIKTEEFEWIYDAKKEAHIQSFLTTPSKKCACGLVNHGWNKLCPYCKKEWS